MSTISRSTGWLSRSKIWTPSRRDDRPVALVEIGDPLGQRRQRQRVRAEIILALAIADGQRRAHARADDQVGMVAEQDGDGEGAVQARQHGRDRVLRRRAALDLAGDQMGDDFAVGLALEVAARRRCSSSRSGLKFSMMPLWTSATGPTMCGWALPTVGAPWVAQRVWAMPIVAGERLARPARARDCRACPRPGGARARRRRWCRCRRES